MRVALTALLVSLCAFSLAASRGQAQDYQMRFEIVAPTDTTFTFVLGDARWVKKGMAGTVVDPRQRDALVARFTVDRIDERMARAIITRTTTGITVFHAALLRVPKKSWWRDKFLWIGTAVGLAIGYFVGRS